LLSDAAVVGPGIINFSRSRLFFSNKKKGLFYALIQGDVKE
jgi:hypothetical protein